MSFYKAIKGKASPFYKQNKILANYIKGIHYTEDGKREDIVKGTTKYNVEFIRSYRKLITEFSHLISVEVTLVQLLKNVDEQQYVQGMIGNLYHLMGAQKKTKGFYEIIIKALKENKIMHNDVYNAIKSDITTGADRIERNQQLVNGIAIDYSLDKFVKYVESKGRTIYEDINAFIYERYKSITVDDFTEATYKGVQQEYVNYVIKLAKEEGLNILKNVNERAKRHFEYRKNIGNHVQETKNIQKSLLLKEKLKNLVDDATSDLQKMINTGESVKYSKYAAKSEAQIVSIIRKAKSLNVNRIFWAAGLRGNSIYFVGKNGVKSESIVNALFAKSEEDLRKKIQEFCLESDKAPIEISSLDIAYTRNFIDDSTQNNELLFIQENIKLNKKLQDINELPNEYRNLIRLDIKYRGTTKYYVGLTNKSTDRFLYYKESNRVTESIENAYFFDTPPEIDKLTVQGRYKDYIRTVGTITFTGLLAKQAEYFLVGVAKKWVLDSVRNHFTDKEYEQLTDYLGQCGDSRFIVLYTSTYGTRIYCSRQTASEIQTQYQYQIDKGFYLKADNFYNDNKFRLNCFWTKEDAQTEINRLVSKRGAIAIMIDVLPLLK